MATASLSMTGCSQSPLESKRITIGIINLAPVMAVVIKGFKAGMKDLGYIEGDNVYYVYEGPTGSIKALEPALNRLKKAEVGLIFSLTTPATLKAKEAVAGTDIPVVFAPVNDPVHAGIINSMRAPGGNLTGIKVGGFVPKGLQMLLRITPGVKNVHVLYNPIDKSSTLGLAELEKAAVKLGVHLIPRKVRSLEEIENASKTIPQGVDAIAILPDSLVESRATYLAEAAIKRKLPLYGVSVQNARAGAVMAYGWGPFPTGKQAARLADQILKGTKPSELPAEAVDFNLTINLKTARAISLHIPDEILQEAEEIIR